MRAIVFDFDGVIVDSEPVHEIALRAALESIGLSLSHEEFLAKCLGVGDRNCLASVAAGQGRTLEAADLDALMETKRRVFVGLVEGGRVLPYPGTITLMRAAAEAGPVGVCTGSGLASVEPVLRRLGVTGLLRAVVTADDVARTKPDPAGYVLVAQRLGVPPASCTAIEDTPTGIAAARAAGLRVAGVCHTLGPEKLSAAHRVFGATAEMSVELLRGV